VFATCDGYFGPGIESGSSVLCKGDDLTTLLISSHHEIQVGPRLRMISIACFSSAIVLLGASVAGCLLLLHRHFVLDPLTRISHYPSEMRNLKRTLSRPYRSRSPYPDEDSLFGNRAKLWSACSLLPLSFSQACLRKFELTPQSSCTVLGRIPASELARIPPHSRFIFRDRFSASKLAGGKAAASCTHSKAPLQMPAMGNPHKHLRGW